MRAWRRHFRDHLKNNLKTSKPPASQDSLPPHNYILLTNHSSRTQPLPLVPFESSHNPSWPIPCIKPSQKLSVIHRPLCCPNLGGSAAFLCNDIRANTRDSYRGANGLNDTIRWNREPSARLARMPKRVTSELMRMISVLRCVQNLATKPSHASWLQDSASQPRLTRPTDEAAMAHTQAQQPRSSHGQSHPAGRQRDLRDVQQRPGEEVRE